MSAIESQPQAPEVSVIVVTHNNASLIGDCLRSVERGARARSHETIVVDSASTDGTLAVIASGHPGVRVLALERNVGFAAATNAGIAASRGRLLALVNSDAFPDEGSIDRLADAIDALPRAAIVGGRLRYPDGAPQPSTGRFPSLLGGLWTALLLHRMPLLGRLDVGVNAHPSHYRVRRRVDWVTAAFCIARREAGPLPERSFMYGEDVEWARESASAGREVWFDPGASAVHLLRGSVAGSRDAGFAQRQRARFELEWFGRRGGLAVLGARAVLAIHALVRLPAVGIADALRRREPRRAREQLALLRAAFSASSARASRPPGSPSGRSSTLL